jgi:hypothetical protein
MPVCVSTPNKFELFTTLVINIMSLEVTPRSCILISYRATFWGESGAMRVRRPMFQAWQEHGPFLFVTASRPALGPTQPPSLWVPGFLSSRVKRPGREADHWPPSSAEAKNAWSCISIAPIRLRGVVCSQTQGQLHLYLRSTRHDPQQPPEPGVELLSSSP